MKGPLLAKLEAIRTPTILVIGDLMLDLYVWGSVDRISPEAPVPVLKVESEEPRPGGAGNVAVNVAALGANVFCCGVVGADAYGRSLCGMLKKLKVDVSGVLHDRARPTILKTRMMAHSQQLMRVDKEECHDLGKSIQSRMLDYITEILPRCDAVLVSDYGKGTLPDEVIAQVIAASRKRGVKVLVDPARQRDYRVYAGCTVLKPNSAEAAQASGMQIVDTNSLAAAASKLRKLSSCEYLVVTQGSEGMTIFRSGAAPVHIASLSRPVFDITGAGDTVLSLLGYVLAGGHTIDAAAEIANVAASIVVGRVGAVPVTKAEITRELAGFHHIASHKVRSLEEMISTCEEHRRRKQKIVFTNGCFDLLHVGHIKLLQFAKNSGEIVVVGLNSDSSVRRLKGQGRPVLEQNERAYILSALEQVDYVVIFDEETPLKLIKAIRPDILVKGADYTKDTVVGRDFVESYGGKVRLAPLIEGVSSSGIISRVVRNSE
ncbi:MAG: D-glycero-beta-D-manno-heptose-7-phosphate kinase [Candidatus Abyssobacteria bacterium SURF_17]|uniref:Bifunctional protein HldE n=1 Tax=Candidatus Abyssobacteria bacterium SURF_17 TaxID=2093361 RepID=A0A419F1Q3_9BACT|nr:MAG: D-glycero-beta-D-manno-heptose-7-phosphate kinase [Candidatus Abyssubacteria bacterium SURF_17]